MTMHPKRAHLETTGTTAIYNKMCPIGIDPTEIAYQITELAYAIKWNQSSIEALEDDLANKDPMSFINLFDQHAMYRHKLNIKLRVRERLFDRWDKLVQQRPVF